MSEILDFLLDLPNPLPVDATEADTRALIIDPLLKQLGWGAGAVRREPYAGWSDSRGFIDYLLLQNGRPLLVIEAKKSGRSFVLPRNLTSQKATTYRKLRATGSADLIEALDQCLRYAQHTGAIYACATNGVDWIFFKPTHGFRSLPEAKVVLFNGIDQLVKRIDEFLELLDFELLQQGSAEKSLVGREVKRPLFAKRLQDAFPYQPDPSLEEEDYAGILDQLLQHYVVELTSELDFEECYCPVKSNRMAISTIRQLISGRSDALRNTPSAEGKNDFKQGLLDSPLFPDSPSGRTVVLHGEVGVGKSSFLRHCEMELRSAGSLSRAVWAKVDLLPFQDRAFGVNDRESMLDLICRSIQGAVSESTGEMSGNYDPDAWAHLRDIYNAEVRKFQKAKYPHSDDSDDDFLRDARDYVWGLSQKDSQDHLVRVIRWLTINCKLPVVLVLDNSDQLGFEFQEFLYKLSEKLKSATSAVVVLVMRTEALASHSIREHSIASVQEQFLVQKAPLAQVLAKRFERILSRVPQAFPGSAHKVARDRISVLIESIDYEAIVGSDSFQIVQASGNGSLRDNLRAISAIFKSSPKAMDDLVVKNARKEKARVGVSLILRALMRDDLSSSDANKLVPNVFIVDSQISTPYALGVRIIQQLRSKSGHIQYSAADLFNDFSLAGVDRGVVERVVQKLRFDRLISVPHMMRDLRGDDVLKVTRLGEVVLDIILSDLSYVSRSAFETYVYDRHVYNDMRSAWTSDTGQFGKKFSAIGRIFSKMVEEDDLVMQQGIDSSLLEPSVTSSLPGVLSEEGRRQLKR